MIVLASCEIPLADWVAGRQEARSRRQEAGDSRQDAASSKQGVKKGSGGASLGWQRRHVSGWTSVVGSGLQWTAGVRCGSLNPTENPPLATVRPQLRNQKAANRSRRPSRHRTARWPAPAKEQPGQRPQRGAALLPRTPVDRRCKLVPTHAQTKIAGGTSWLCSVVSHTGPGTDLREPEPVPGLHSTHLPLFVGAPSGRVRARGAVGSGRGGQGQVLLDHGDGGRHDM